MTEFLRRVPEWIRFTGDQAIDAFLDPMTIYGRPINFRLEEIRLHLSDVGGADDFECTLISHYETESEGEAESESENPFDALLISQDMTALRNFVWRPSNEQRILFQAGDILHFEWENDSNVTYGLEIIWSEVKD